ncbi:chaperonin 10-like protein [Calycina marina]|uniref:Chaperonin 10-like protein n=1 Tax=Calycina marina TaxID=1763456 RepID=A0A9P8CD23_9HELO|nr:chaperonin 10-like protein [Calycina marina]
MSTTVANIDTKQSKIPKTCKAGCVVNAGPDFKIAVEDVPVPEPGPNEILLRLNATGVCYSDLHYMLEDLPMPRMSDFQCRSPGHEGAGVVVAVGSNVTNWKIGDRGGVKPMWDICMNCELCWDGKHETYCAGAVACGLMVAGTYQQYITSPARYTTRIPDNVDDFTAGPIMCSGSTIYSSIIASELKPGDWAVFPGGGGGVGHMGVQLAKAMGMRVIAIDGGAEKRALCEKLGAEEFIDYTTVESVEAEVLRITSGIGAHGIFVTTGSPAAYKIAPMMVRTGGRVMCVGLRSATVGADPAWFILKNLHVIGTMVGSMKDTDKALDFAARGLLKPTYEKFSINHLPEAVQKLRDGKVAGRCVVDFNA